MDLIDTDVAIETPEHIVFRYRIAGPGRRALAHLVDQIVCLAAIVTISMLVFFVALVLGRSLGFADMMGVTQGLLLLLLFAVEWGYFVYFEATRGASLGKQALGMRVVTVTGKPIGFSHAALRNLLRAADALPLGYTAGIISVFAHAAALLYPAGLVAMLVTRRMQRLGDVVAGTMVVVVDRSDRAEPIAVAPPNEYEAAALPMSLTVNADERSALELFLRRRRLGRQREEELATMVTPLFASRLQGTLPDPVRLLALLYDRARSAGRGEGPPSSHGASLPPPAPGAGPAGGAPWR